jgi:hypothetical protein
MEMACCMLHSQSMKLHFCGVVVVCVTFIINHTPTNAISSMTPYERFHGQKPSISHFSIFGSRAWVYLPHQRRDISLVQYTPH